MSQKKIELLLILILIIAAILRFYHYSSWSLSNDELSALNRIRYDCIKDVVKHGSMMEDTHPAGVHVFIYLWVNIFGNSVSSVRLPFIISGIFSVLLSYQIAKKWFNCFTGLFTAAAMSVLGYTILYSQLARPYSFGLMFSLASVYFWTIILFEKTKFWHYAAFVFAMAGAAYSHYFSQMFAAIVGITGFFFVKKENIKKYIFSGIAIFILYIPHIKVFLYQYKNGFENVSWLSKPDSDWFWKYIKFCFNNSFLVATVIIALITIFIIANLKKTIFSKMQIIALLWFLLPFFIGYYFSVYRTPVLQNSVLLFSFPFLLILIFSFIPDKSTLFVYVTLAIFTVSGISSTVVEREFYKVPHFSEFKDLAVRIAKWNKTYGSNNITRTANLNSPYYIHYYLDKLNDNSKFEKYKFTDENDLGKMLEIVNNSTTPFFVYTASNVYNPPDLCEVIRSKYPYIVEEKYYKNSSVILFKRDSSYNRPVAFQFINDFEKPYKYWESDSSMLDSTQSVSGKHSCRLDEKKIYSSTFAMRYSDFPVKDSCLISITVDAFLSINSDAVLALSIEKPRRENEWHITKIHKLITEPNKWGKAYLARAISNKFESGDLIKIFVWNTGKEILYIDNFSISFYPQK